MSELKFTHTERGSPKACYLGYCYNLNKNSKHDGTVSFWLCEMYWKNKCTARMHVKDGKPIRFHGSHNHAPNSQSKEVLDVAAENRLKAAITHVPTEKIIEEVTNNLDPNVLAQISSDVGLKRKIMRARKNRPAVPDNPACLEDLVLLPEHQQSDDGEPFLWYDSGTSSDRIYIFATAQNIELLSVSEKYFSNATPLVGAGHLFQQVHTIHVALSDRRIPLMYALLPDKSGHTYRRLFGTVKLLLPDLNPTSWMAGFEKDVIEAMKENFPAVSMTGCLFHLQQSIWHKTRELELVDTYHEEDCKFANSVRSLVALAFVPQQHVETAFNELSAMDEFDVRAQPIADYFEETWIGRPVQNQARPAAVFPMSYWNVYQHTLDDHRLNKSIEQWHKHLKSSVNYSRSSVFRCINAIKTEQKQNEQQIQRINADPNSLPRKRKYNESDEHILNIVKQYTDYSMTKYLQEIACHIKLSTKDPSDSSNQRGTHRPKMLKLPSYFDTPYMDGNIMNDDDSPSSSFNAISPVCESPPMTSTTSFVNEVPCLTYDA